MKMRDVSAEGRKAVIERCHGTPQRLALTRTEAAKAIGVSPRTIDSLIADRANAFPLLRIGSRVLIPVGLLEIWLAEQAKKNGDRQ